VEPVLEVVVDIEVVEPVLGVVVHIVVVEMVGEEERTMAVLVLAVDTEAAEMAEVVRMMASVELVVDTVDILERILEQVQVQVLEMVLGMDQMDQKDHEEVEKDHEVEKLGRSEYLARNHPRCNRLLFDNIFLLNQANKCTKSLDYQEVWML